MLPTNRPAQSETLRAYRPLQVLLPAHWHQHTITAPDGASLRVTDSDRESDRNSILLLHGLQVSGLSWLRVARALAGQYRILMPDWRGHGESARVGEQEIDSNTLLADAVRIVEHFALDDGGCHIVGHSLGADLAGRLAAVKPFASCTLVEPALQDFSAVAALTEKAPPPWLASILETLAALPALPHQERLQRALTLLPAGAPLYGEEDYVSFVAGQAQFDPNFFRHIGALGHLFQEPRLIQQIACPLLLMTARAMMPGGNLEAGLRAFSENWRRGQHQHFPHCGHAIMFDDLAGFLRTLRCFWDAL